ncbi:branched-chain amino acid aminotransferase [Thermotomaculum hydrothermale]|uniref:Branched-chain-amino-acid aminotransferase n=1 Tax=Thermotomaculum hydrothermale TaxID=981385 RepID=A0A7R6PE37_9BACT|nr:branched-chain amino acid transaminase [Thermotomaculum hydrothermale]BBB31998.1 branched-chain amino acid aminotransferase [Thermotomaculum hydrothermale]
MFSKKLKVWMKGKIIDFEEAKVSVLCHALHYGTSFFEGIRAYKTKKGTAIFRLKEHVDRLYNSAKIYRTEIPFTRDELIDAIVNLIKINNLEACYIRPLVYRGLGALGVNPFNSPVEVMIAVWEWGAYLGEDAITKGVDVKVSTWTKIAPNTLPAMAKAGANYMNSQLAKMEAIVDGYEEGILLNAQGFVAEGSGENLFLIKDGKIYTTPYSSSILPGITRDSAIKIAKDFGYKVIETSIPREWLYIADELFFTGTAAEVTPIKSVDRIPVGEGSRGPITEKIQSELFSILRGEKEDRYNWLSYI